MTVSHGRVRTAARVVLGLWTLTMAVALFLPGEIVARSDLSSPDKLIHMGVFAVWAGLAVVAGAPIRAVLLAGAVFAAGTEAVQTLWTAIHRAGDPADFVADVLGMGLGVLAARVLLRWRAAPEA